MTNPDPHLPLSDKVGFTATETGLRREADLHLFLSLLEAVPGFALILDGERRIIASNRRLLEMLGLPTEGSAGRRPGEAFGCAHSEEETGGCGAAEACTVCGAARAIIGCLERRQPVTEECRIERSVGPSAALDVEVTAVPIDGAYGHLIAFFIRDISGEKRRRVLERFFFHDVLNHAGACEGLSHLLAEETCANEDERDELQHLLADGMSQLVDEIQSHRQLMNAEAGELEVELADSSIGELVEEVARLCRHLNVARGREVIAAHPARLVLRTDSGLLRRVLINLVKNALEATPVTGTVTLRAEVNRNRVLFTVHNPTAMPQEVRLQVFKRSFSTKGPGRGVGTYSIKLLTEEYLGGTVSFTSDEAEGTIFRVVLPVNAPPT